MNIFNYFSDFRIAQIEAGLAENRAGDARLELQNLQRTTDALTLACQALWEIVRTQTGLDDQALLLKMEEIDVRDGTQDGKIKPAPVQCPQCHRRTSSNRRECLYCGTPLPVEHVFETS